GASPPAYLLPYLSQMAENAWRDSLRKKTPKRTHLKDRLEDALARDSRLALWRGPSARTRLSGLAGWDAGSHRFQPTPQYQEALKDPWRFAGGLDLDDLVGMDEAD